MYMKQELTAHPHWQTISTVHSYPRGSINDNLIPLKSNLLQFHSYRRPMIASGTPEALMAPSAPTALLGAHMYITTRAAAVLELPHTTLPHS